MDPSLTSLLTCLEQLTHLFDAVRHGAGSGLGVEFDPELALARECKELEHVLREVYGRRLRQPPTHFPTRYTRLEDSIRERNDWLADKVAPYFFQADPLADEADAQLTELNPPGRGRKVFDMALERRIAAVADAPPALRCLFAHLEDIPVWLDNELLNLGCRTHQRCGLLSGIVLGTCCLPLAYRSEAGNKALVRTGRINRRSMRRLSETNHFVIDTFTPHGLKPYAQGWKTIATVRMNHAAMRRWIRQQKERPWNDDDLGAPINQVDMAATNLLFSVSLLRSLRKIGFHFNSAQAEGVMHLWRYVGHLLGIAPELLCHTESGGGRLFDLLMACAGKADRDSVELTRMLMEYAMPGAIAITLPWLPRLVGGSCEQRVHALGRFCYGLSQGLLGDELAAELRYPPTPWRRIAPLLLWCLIAPLELCRRLIPGGTRLATHIGVCQLERMQKNSKIAKPIELPGLKSSKSPWRKT